MGLMRLLALGLLAYLGYRVYKSVTTYLAVVKENEQRKKQKKTAPRGDPTAFEVLGLPSSASQDEIRAAYQKLIQQYHPDRVAGLGPELRELAEKRTKEINAAYTTLKRS